MKKNFFNTLINVSLVVIALCVTGWLFMNMLVPLFIWWLIWVTRAWET